MIGEDFGSDGYEVSYHSHPRPEHADMGGGQFAKGPARTVKGVYYPSFEEVAEPLLNEYGCLHFKFSILLGISVPAHTKEQLEEFKARDKQTFEFEGHKYTAYEGKQLQGRIESAIKYQKDLANTAKKAGDDDLRREAQYNINVLTNKYAKLSEASGLPTRMERLQMAGFRPVNEARTASGQAKYKAIINAKSDKAQYDKYISILGKDNMPETFDLFQKMKYNNSGEWEDIKSKVRTKNYLQEQLSYIWYGEKCFIPTNTRFVTVVTIAGPGTEDPVKILDYLMKTYGGAAEDWTKKAGQVKSKKYIFDVHWFEKDGIQYETKLKYRKERKI